MEMTAQEIADNIDLQVQVIAKNIDFQVSKVRIHRYAQDAKEDLVRSAYAIFSLARSGNFKFFTSEELQKLGLELEARILQDFSNQGIVAFCYLLRYKKILNLNTEDGLRFLEQQDLQVIYAHPVSMYVFVSTITELGLDKSSYLFSIKSECIKNLEYLLFSGVINSLPVFSLAEVNYWKDFLEPHFYKESRSYVLNSLQDMGRVEIKTIASSGLAKCLEFLALEKSQSARNLTKKIFTELDTRIVSKHPSSFGVGLADQLLSEHMYFEDVGSGHIHLDTNIHLLHYYLNLQTVHVKTI